MNIVTLKHLTGLRKELHTHPEISGEEKQTAQRIINEIRGYKPDEIITGLGGYGIAAVFKGALPGPALMFRAELDALPLQEENTFEHRSAEPGKAHLCGHDGHMAILGGLARHLSLIRPKKGKIILLYQPAEETGAGAENVINNQAFAALQPDFVFAIHNLPGFPLHQVIVSDRHFAAASTGMIIRLKGASSHAAEPEKGRSPSQAVAEIIGQLESLPGRCKLKSFALLTIIHARIGNVAFGTTPGEAVVMATLRAYENDDLENLGKAAEDIVRTLSQKHKLEYEISYTETFPATINNPEANRFVKKAAISAGFVIHEIEQPFKWTEDFGHFTASFKAALIGLGSGQDHPALHHADYDFPDELIPTGVSLLQQICREMGMI